MKDLRPKLINIETAYNIAVANLVRVARKELLTAINCGKLRDHRIDKKSSYIITPSGKIWDNMEDIDKLKYYNTINTVQR